MSGCRGWAGDVGLRARDVPLILCVCHNENHIFEDQEGLFSVCGVNSVQGQDRCRRLFVGIASGRASRSFVFPGFTALCGTIAHVRVARETTVLVLPFPEHFVALVLFKYRI